MAEWYDNINRANTRLNPTANPNNYGSMYGIGVNQNFVPRNIDRPMPAGVSPFPPKEEIINEDIRLDVGNNLPITPNIPKPGENWPGFGIPRALAETGFRMKGGPYYSQKFPSREFTEGDRTYNQSGLGGYYHPDEVFNMQEFGGVGAGDPRKDKFDKNIVSFADDYEEGLEDWVGKYGTRKSTDKGFLKRRSEKIRMLNKIQARDAQIEASNRAASAAHLARVGITSSAPGGGGGAFIDPGGRDRGGAGAFRENISQMRGAGRSYTDAQGNVGYSSGRAEGGRIGYQEGELVEDEYMAEATPGGMMEENIEEVQGEPSREQLEAIAFEIFQLPLEQLNEQQLEVVYQAAMEQEPSEEEVQFAAQEGPGEGIASLV